LTKTVWDAIVDFLISFVVRGTGSEYNDMKMAENMSGQNSKFNEQKAESRKQKAVHS